MTPSQRSWSGGPLFPQPQGHALCFQSHHCGHMHSLLSPLATTRRPGWPQIWGTAIIFYYIRLIIYPVVQWFFIWDMQPVSFDCVGCHHIYIYIFMITINPFWSNSLRLYAKPKFGSYTPQDLYIKPELYCLCMFQDQAHLIVRCAIRTNDKRSLVPVAISIPAPQYLLDVQSLPSLPSGIPISSDVQFRYQWQKVTWFMSSHHTPFFYKNDTLNSVGQPKGTSSREVKLVLWRAYHLHFIHFPLSVSTCRVWLSSTIVCPLKEDGLPTSLAAT